MFRKEGAALQKGRGHGSMFDNANRGKKSVVLDLKKPEDISALRSLLQTADVFVTNVRGEALKRIGLDYETLRASYPGLVYAHLTAYGQTGPDKDLPGYDVGAFFAATGIQDLLRPDDAAGTPRYAGGFGDHATAGQLVAGVAMALLHKHRTGQGQLVDACLFRSGLYILGCPAPRHFIRLRL